MVLVNVEFVGTLRGAAGKKNEKVSIDEPATVRILLRRLADTILLKKVDLFSTESSDPVSDILVLVDGKEIGVLAGMNTRLIEGSCVALVPVSHGG